MQLMRTALAAIIVLGMTGASASSAFAQNASARQVNVKLLPISLHRIQRELQQSTSTENHHGLLIRYQVDVYGRAPALELFTRGEDLVNGPVPQSAPTHKEMLEMMTPQEFRAPAADFSAFMRWLADKTKK